VGPRVSLDDVEKGKFLTLLGLELRPHGRPARSQSLPAPQHLPGGTEEKLDNFIEGSRTSALEFYLRPTKDKEHHISSD
jgi:hypothetical protein